MAAKEYVTIDLYAFWGYDAPPWVLGGRVSRMGTDGKVYADSYQAWFTPVRLLPVEAGEQLEAALRDVRDAYAAAVAEATAAARKAVAKLLPGAV